MTRYLSYAVRVHDAFANNERPGKGKDGSEGCGGCRGGDVGEGGAGGGTGR